MFQYKNVIVPQKYIFKSAAQEISFYFIDYRFLTNHLTKYLNFIRHFINFELYSPIISLE